MWTIGRYDDLAREPLLAQRLKQNQRRAIGKIQGTSLGVEHGNAKPAIPILFQQRFRKSCRLPPENQVVVWFKVNFGIAPRSA